MLTRNIEKIHPKENEFRFDCKLTFADILEIPNIVLLGEPGASKTHLFQSASKHENGNYISAKNFAIYADDSYTDRTVYIDALDEKRSRGEPQDSISEIIKNFRQFKPSKLRISCRAADWLGETDLDLFKPYFDVNGGYFVFALQALTEDEVDHIHLQNKIENPREFREKADSKGISSLLSNPFAQTAKWNRSSGIG